MWDFERPRPQSQIPRPSGSRGRRWETRRTMRKFGKNIGKARAAVEARSYTLQDAVPLLQKVKYAKFDETVDLTMRLGVDPKHADQMVRGTVVLPHGLGKTKKVLVIASGEKVREAEAAGADIVGGEDMVEKIQKENWTDFDAVIATPDMMKSVGRLGKVLGPRGLMPNPKTGTVTFDGAGACAGGQDFVFAGEVGGECRHGDYQRDQGKAHGSQGQIHQGLLSQLHHGSGCLH